VTVSKERASLLFVAEASRNLHVVAFMKLQQCKKCVELVGGGGGLYWKADVPKLCNHVYKVRNVAVNQTLRLETGLVWMTVYKSYIYYISCFRK